MKKIILSLFIASLIGIVCTINQDVLSYSSGAPVGSTNAPGETTCATNPLCHNSAPNTGSGGTILMTMEDVSNGYVPGTVYNIMPYVTQTGSSKIGFQAVALLANGQGAGSVTITNAKTQMNPSGGKEYVTHTASGNTGVGLHDWMYEWTAPSQGSGTVTIYGTFLASNNDMTASGDSIYTDSLVITEKTTGIEDARNDYFRINSLSQVSADEFVMDYFSKETFLCEISVYSINGKQVKFAGETFYPGSHRMKLSLEHPAGIYFININFAGRREVFKIVKI